MIHQIIKSARLSKGISQEYMADTLKISQAQYSRIEIDGSGISAHRIQLITQFLQITISFPLPLNPINPRKKPQRKKRYRNNSNKR